MSTVIQWVLCILASVCPSGEPTTAPEPTEIIEEAESAMGFGSPVDYRPMRVTSDFDDSRTYGRHGALDIGCKERGCGSGQPKILAVAAGTISRVGWDPDGYGLWIEIDHGGGTKTRYAHLAEISEELAVEGSVDQGHQIGVMGESGLADGVHLHFEIIENGTRIDPEGVLCDEVAACDLSALGRPRSG